jgi:hypothetical protein
MRCSPFVLCWCGILGIVTSANSRPAASAEASSSSQRLSFDRDVRPILSDNCFGCHGPDGGSRQAGLRLDVQDAAIAELESGSRAIVPGRIADSELVARITSDDPDLVMPPPEAKIGRLSAEQVETLTAWIAGGATFEPHWTFVPPARPGTVDAAVAVDRIVAAKLATRGLALQPEADRRTLIRRVTFDITGLPPTPAEVEAFVTDTSPDAYETLLDRLLASPRYGERMAADWMDLARYSDSYGFQQDRPRPDMWPWRDWVIRSFNANLPWDRFALWQVAGDLVPRATDEQVLATAFNRLHQQENEGGSIEEEYRVAYVNDRTTTFGTAFLGLTLECCRCHDHKFDPLSQKDFYSLSAFFDDIDEAGLYSFFTDSVPTPNIRLLDGPATAALARADEAVAEAEAGAARAEAGARAAVSDWIAGQAAVPAAFEAVGGTIPGELVRHAFDDRRADGTFADELGSTAVATAPEENIVVDDARGGGPCRVIRLTGDHPVTTSVGKVRRSQPFTVAAWIKPASRHDRAVVFHRSRAWTDAGSRGYELLIDGGHLRWSLIHFWPGDAASVRCAEPLAVGDWTHVAVSSDGSGRAAGLKIYVNGHVAATEVVRDSLTREITGGGGETITIGERFRDHGLKHGLVDDFRFFGRALSPLEVQDLFAPGTITAALAEIRDAEALGDYFAAAFADEPAATRAALEAARRGRDDLAERPHEIMVMRELPQPRTAYVLERGDYDKRGEPVEPDTPAALPPFPADQPRNRLGLARWLIDPEHPLLARVTVNRLWQSLFGIGLVQSAEDLGSQSTRPEYPEVLDLLAWQFAHATADGGIAWDMKRLMKTIMRSATYRQRSMADAKTMADDPLNVWLARGPRHRLPAEMIRDGALAATGLLVEKMGGPPVKTYDMPDSFKPEKADTGGGLYRRSLYTFWRRTGPAPVLESFDVPKRMVCVARRDTTNTPLHALVLLNGPQFVEAGRVLAERLLVEHDGRAEQALDRAFEMLTSRPPDDEEKRIIRRMHAGQLDWYRDRPDEAARLLTVGETRPQAAVSAVEVAAAAGVVNALMNYDGVVVKR